MSKAFTREETEPPLIVPPRAPLPEGVPNYVTPRGLARLRDEMVELEAELADAATSSDGAGREPAQAALAMRRSELEHRIASAYLPTVTLDEASGLARSLLTDENRVVLAVAPDKADVPAPTEESLVAAMTRAGSATVEAWTDSAAGRTLVEHPPEGGTVTGSRMRSDLGVTVLTLSNGVTVWLKPTE